MEAQVLHMLTMKMTLLLALALTATACGMNVDDRDDETKAKEGDAGKNELVMITDGAYSLELNSSGVDCQKLVDDQIVEMRFRETTGADAGLAIDLRAAGDFDAGDALTPDNSGKDRFFDFALTTPAGVNYAYTSTGFGNALKPSYATLTILKSTRYVTAGWIWIENLPGSSADPGPTGTPGALSVRASFECAHWD